MPKQLLFNEKARTALKKGINKFQLNFEQFFRPIDIHKKSGDKRQLYCFFQKIFLE